MIVAGTFHERTSSSCVWSALSCCFKAGFCLIFLGRISCSSRFFRALSDRYRSDSSLMQSAPPFLATAEAQPRARARSFRTFYFIFFGRTSNKKRDFAFRELFSGGPRFDDERKLHRLSWATDHMFMHAGRTRSTLWSDRKGNRPVPANEKVHVHGCIPSRVCFFVFCVRGDGGVCVYRAR